MNNKIKLKISSAHSAPLIVAFVDLKLWTTKSSTHQMRLIPCVRVHSIRSSTTKKWKYHSVRLMQFFFLLLALTFSCVFQKLSYRFNQQMCGLKQGFGLGFLPCYKEIKVSILLVDIAFLFYFQIPSCRSHKMFLLFISWLFQSWLKDSSIF